MKIIKIAGGSSQPKTKIKQPVVLKRGRGLHAAKKKAHREARANRKLAKKSHNDQNIKKAFARANTNKHGFAHVYVEHGASKPHRTSTMRKVATGFAVLSVLFILGALGNFILSGKSLPNTFIADINVGAMSQEDIVAILHQEFERTPINIISGKTKTTASLSRLGIEIDYEKTAENVISLANQRSFFSIFNLGKKSINIVADYNLTKTQTLISKAFADIERTPADAEVIWNDGKKRFEVIPSVRGQKLSAETIAARTVSFLSSVDFIDIHAEPIEIVPEIETPDADALKDYLNSEILGLQVEIPPIANTKSAQAVKTFVAQKLQNTSGSYGEIASVATSILLR